MADFYDRYAEVSADKRVGFFQIGGGSTGTSPFASCPQRSTT